MMLNHFWVLFSLNLSISFHSECFIRFEPIECKQNAHWSVLPAEYPGFVTKKRYKRYDHNFLFLNECSCSCPSLSPQCRPSWRSDLNLRARSQPWWRRSSWRRETWSPLSCGASQGRHWSWRTKQSASAHRSCIFLNCCKRKSLKQSKKIDF